LLKQSSPFGALPNENPVDGAAVEGAAPNVKAGAAAPVVAGAPKGFGDPKFIVWMISPECNRSVNYKSFSVEKTAQSR
jgi:hypothetical protein